MNIEDNRVKRPFVEEGWYVVGLRIEGVFKEDLSVESVSPDEEWVEKFACAIEPVYYVFETNDEVICDVYGLPTATTSVRYQSPVYVEAQT